MPPATALLLQPCPTFHHLSHLITGCWAGLPKDRAWLVLHQLQGSLLCFRRSQKGFLSPRPLSSRWVLVPLAAGPSGRGSSSCAPPAVRAAPPHHQQAQRLLSSLGCSLLWSFTELFHRAFPEVSRLLGKAWWWTEIRWRHRHGEESPQRVLSERNLPSVSLGFPVNSPYFIILL